MAGTSVILLLYLLLFLTVPVLIGVYVYRDASSRHMNAVLWTLIAVIAPSLIGFIIYLFVRGTYSNLKCRVCGTVIRDDYAVCPTCGAKLKPLCPSCSAPVKPGWKVCPRCAHPLPETQDDITAPVQKKDRLLPKILLAVILIPVILIILFLAAFTAIGSGSVGAGVTTLPADEYIQENGNPEITEWLDRISPDENKAYVLRHEENTDSETVTQFLVYMPVLEKFPDISVTPKEGFFKNTLELNISPTGESGGNTVILATFTGSRSGKLKIIYNGRDIDCNITDVEYSLKFAETGEETMSSAP